MRRVIEAMLPWHYVNLSATRHRGGSGRTWGGWVALFFVLIFVPSLAKAGTINVQFVAVDSPISSLNPSSTKFDVVYQAGTIKSEDGSTTFGSFLETVPRYSGTAGSFNSFDGVAVLPGGNIYFKMVHNFADSSERGIIIGGDGAFAGTTGSITRISLTVHQVTFP